MPSTLVGSKRNITGPSNLLATDGEKLQSIDPDNRAESLSKRLRPEKPAVKVLPCRYEEANPRDLVVLISISSLTVHRFLISSATVASKGLSDSFWTNKTYARVGGISIAELALLELEFLWRVEWRIVPQPEVLEDYYQRLVERCDEYVIQPGKDIDAQPTEKDETAATSSIMRNGGSTSATDATATTTASTK
ncbi:conserved hypothetical protein [Histoplasma mississippiense (nom. inval.)]|uniref:conserved hypothetical protein n=1 Tax=Ajellomyces capsulatus (strain NAm1 / WU24) TaxID=2059318 RepID=UPI000157B844|nr:conserved hypothetical protein [Histoplasma mississippiense (nom. inval.)]EDN03505.1 conserved hypothetical protein [Histoplasma mississippiense (nom. inval.)]